MDQTAIAVKVVESRFVIASKRLVGDAFDLDLGSDHRARLDRRASDASLGKIFLEHAVVTAEVARVLEERRYLYHVPQVAARVRENTLNRFERGARFLFDRAGDHVAVRILGHLAGHVDEVARPHRRMEREIRVLFAVDLDFRMSHGGNSQVADSSDGTFDDAKPALAIDQINKT